MHSSTPKGAAGRFARTLRFLNHALDRSRRFSTRLRVAPQPYNLTIQASRVDIPPFPSLLEPTWNPQNLRSFRVATQHTTTQPHAPPRVSFSRFTAFLDLSRPISTFLVLESSISGSSLYSKPPRNPHVGPRAEGHSPPSVSLVPEQSRPFHWALLNHERPQPHIGP